MFTRKNNKKKLKVPVTLQLEAVECGAASLRMILEYFGKRVPLEEVREKCGVSRDGSKALNMLKAARNYGLEAEGYRREPDTIKDLPLPMIIHWNFNHFVVLKGWSSKKYFINDPALGPQTVDLEEFDRSFTGIALSFSLGENFVRGGKKSGVLRSLLPRVKNYKAEILFLIFAGVLLVVPNIIRPTISKIFYEDVLIEGLHSWVRPILTALIFTATLGLGIDLLQQLTLIRLETRLGITTATQFLEHLFKLPIEFFNQRSSGDIMSRVELNHQVTSLLTGGIAMHSLNLIMIVFYGIVLIQYNLTLTIVGIAVCLLNIIALKIIGKVIAVLSMTLRQNSGKYTGAMMNGLQIIQTLRSSGVETDYMSRLYGLQANAVNSGQKMSRISIMFSSIPSLLASLNSILILVLGAFQIIDGWFTIGMLVAFRAMMGSFTGPISSLVGLGAQIQEMKGDLMRLDDVLAYKEDVQFTVKEQKADVTKPKLDGFLELKNLTFGYSKLEESLITDFNLKLTPGQRVALVGGSGSGKSTVAKLVAGLYQPWEGEILFDNCKRNEYMKEYLSNSIAFVDQDIFIFDGSVKDNLTMWNDGVNEEHIIRACKDAAIHQEISTRAGGYESSVNEGGSNFSGGQRQRLEIARALVGNPTVLVMDEATSALDPPTEKIIDQNIRRRGITALIIAHRLSTIRDCDEIIVMDKGKIIQRGTHEELFEQKGYYYELIRMS